ncbi:MAG: hypothetical protein A2X94_04210 [Bdellovibrionales bacterium GWB1_55_8]|nr:MAG: hypothetical protein A2X94_04210 [Bdellovibrionales bacterium GWB1_55_8]
MVSFLLVVDRGFFGPIEHPGWLRAASLAEIPSSAGKRVFPAYLPETLRWPPERIFHREKPVPGWWVGLVSNEKPEEVALWVGSGSEPLPEEFAYLRECLRDRARCPEGWHVFSSNIEGIPVFLITRIDPASAAQILTELKPET